MSFIKTCIKNAKLADEIIDENGIPALLADNVGFMKKGKNVKYIQYIALYLRDITNFIIHDLHIVYN